MDRLETSSKRELRPKTVPEFLEAAGYALKGGQVPVALKCLDRALALEPENALVHSLLGVVFKSMGKLDLAEKAYRKSLEYNGKQLEPLNNLGNLLVGQRRYQEAIPHLLKAVELNENFYQSHNTLDIAYLKSNQIKKALQHFTRSVEIQPDFGIAHQNLGQAYLFLKQLDEAERAFDQASEHIPDSKELQLNRARLALAKNDQQEAIRLAVPLAQPGDGEMPQALMVLGQIHERQKNYPKAVRSYERALSLGYRPIQMVIHLGAIKIHQLNLYEEGLELLKAGLKRDPNNEDAKCCMAGCFTILGKLDEAEAILKEVLELNPDNAHAYRQLAHIKKKETGEAPDIEKMLAKMKKDDLLPNQRTELCYGLGDAFDQRGEHDQAFRYFKEGNDRDSIDNPFDMEQPRRMLEVLKKVFTKEFFEERKYWGLNTEVPVFIVGMPRSGTTLTEQIIASHPQAFGAGELKSMGEMKQKIRKNFNLKHQFPKVVEHLSQDQVETLAEDHLAFLRSMDEDAARITDKMPFNYYTLGLIHLLFPKAPLIHCMRHPLDNCLSCYFLRFVDKMSFSTNLEQLGEIYTIHSQIMDHWKSVLPVPILEAQYEQTVADQEWQTRLLLEHCGLEWDDTCMEFHKYERPVKTASNWQVRQPIYNTSDGRWKNYREHLVPLMDSLGLDPKSLD